MEVEFYGYSDIGGRDENEDSYRILESDGVVCAVVADGLGGHGKGKEASEIAVKRLTQCASGGSVPDENVILEAMKKANSDIENLRENDRQMKTTVVCLYLGGFGAICAHIGDSRLYHYYNYELKDFTLDHSVSQLAVTLGEIERKDIPGHSERNRVLRAIGNEELLPEFKRLELRNGFHAFLLCTDGFWEYLREDEILMDLHKVRSPEEWIKSLRYRLVKRINGDNDNNTAAAVFIKV